MDLDKVIELLSSKPDGSLCHRESKELEFKEQYNHAGLDDYLKSFAAFANNCGGYMIFGVKDNPRRLVGLNLTSKSQFDAIDQERITNCILEVFSSNIDYELRLVRHYNKDFGVIFIRESYNKPVIAKKDNGRDQQIKNGEVYYRYGGRSQKIQHAELESIIRDRIQEQVRNMANLITKIVKIGPTNAAILDTDSGTIQKNDKQVLVIDKDLVHKIKFIREGQFDERVGATTLKLIGDVVPIETVEIVQYQQEKLLEKYPLTYDQLVGKVRAIYDSAKKSQINLIIKDNCLKHNLEYSAFNFRNKLQEDEYERSRLVPSGVPSIYNQKAVDYITQILLSC